MKLLQRGQSSKGKDLWQGAHWCKIQGLGAGACEAETSYITHPRRFLSHLSPLTSSHLSSALPCPHPAHCPGQPCFTLHTFNACRMSSPLLLSHHEYLASRTPCLYLSLLPLRWRSLNLGKCVSWRASSGTGRPRRRV